MLVDIGLLQTRNPNLAKDLGALGSKIAIELGKVNQEKRRDWMRQLMRAEASKSVKAYLLTQVGEKIEWRDQLPLAASLTALFWFMHNKDNHDTAWNSHDPENRFGAIVMAWECLTKRTAWF